MMNDKLLEDFDTLQNELLNSLKKYEVGLGFAVLSFTLIDAFIQFNGNREDFDRRLGQTWDLLEKHHGKE
jgi:hypothetical protein